MVYDLNKHHTRRIREANQRIGGLIGQFLNEIKMDKQHGSPIIEIAVANLKVKRSYGKP
jgi:hypothetical protein